MHGGKQRRIRHIKAVVARNIGWATAGDIPDIPSSSINSSRTASRSSSPSPLSFPKPATFHFSSLSSSSVSSASPPPPSRPHPSFIKDALQGSQPSQSDSCHSYGATARNITDIHKSNCTNHTKNSANSVDDNIIINNNNNNNNNKMDSDNNNNSSSGNTENGDSNNNYAGINITVDSGSDSNTYTNRHFGHLRTDSWPTIAPAPIPEETAAPHSTLMRRSESSSFMSGGIADSSLTKSAYKRKSKLPDISTSNSIHGSRTGSRVATPTTATHNNKDSLFLSDYDLKTDGEDGDDPRLWKERGLLDTYLTLSLPVPLGDKDDVDKDEKTAINKSADDDTETWNHTTTEQSIFYTSETIPNSTNPAFLTDMTLIDWYNAVQTVLVVRLWAKHSIPESASMAKRTDPIHVQGNHSLSPAAIQDGAPYRVLIEWYLNLNELVYIGKSLQGVYIWPHNTLLFALDDGYYTAPDIAAFAVSQQKRSHQCLDAQLLDVESASIDSTYSPRTKRSYTYHHIMRLNTLKECIFDAQKSADELEHDINEILEKDKHKIRLVHERAQKETRLKEIESTVHEQQALIDQDRKNVDNMRQSLDKRKLELKRSQERFLIGKNDLENNDTQLEKNIKMHSETFTKLTQRKKELIADLFSIYPIEQSFDDLTQFRIRGIYLPNSVYTGCNEEMIATALGFTGHLVSMLAFYLSIPLRYPINPMGSRATIYDPVSLINGSRVFPLYGKGVDRYRFEFGVFLLNKNIEQMMNSYGLIVMDLRHTLPNIHYFIQAVLTTSVTSGPTSISVLSISSYAQGRDRPEHIHVNGKTVSAISGKAKTNHQQTRCTVNDNDNGSSESDEDHGENHLTLQPTKLAPISVCKGPRPSPTISTQSISHSPKLGVSPASYPYAGVHISSQVAAAPAVLDTVTTSSCQKPNHRES